MGFIIISTAIVKIFQTHWKSGLVALLIMMCGSGPWAALTIQLNSSIFAHFLGQYVLPLCATVQANQLKD